MKEKLDSLPLVKPETAKILKLDKGVSPINTEEEVIKKPKWKFPIVDKTVNSKPSFNKIGDRMEAVMRNPTIIQEAIKNKKL